VCKPSRVPPRKVPDDAALAWELAAAAHPHLSRCEADRIYVAIGVGDAFDAIDALITAIARDRIRLGNDLVATVVTWLDRYVGQPTEPRLRQLIAEVQTSLPAATERPGPLLVAEQYRHRRSDCLSGRDHPDGPEIPDGKLASPSELPVARRTFKKDFER
jgi:hypothetical protein